MIFNLETGQNLDVVTEPEKVLDLVTSATLNARMEQVFPAAGSFTVIAVSPDAGALPGACVITRPEQAVNCK